ncbi:hypothetical protein Mgra_00008326 [Meloidogyne graminicola]|uniref:Uncharacterized protein n=1 Tax=Meloidogyne graminicola TaxID=189291 RepID=A0A8S9ZG15_9BILA|nr:hypothetical protein Mgra_00008326 [Meloidogyne graminicola]
MFNGHNGQLPSKRINKNIKNETFKYIYFNNFCIIKRNQVV